MRKKRFLPIVFFVVILSGCMYPQDQLSQNQIPYEDQVVAVQKAVRDYQIENGGILPIKTKEGNTPIYQKYPIDFQRIVPKFLSSTPGNSFENGGIFQYVLIDVETKPTVKLLDLRIAETIREIKMRINANGGYPPYKDKISERIFTIDFSKLGYKEEPIAISPFTQENLPFIVSVDGEIYVDYRIDLFKKIKESKAQLNQGEDIRNLLTSDSLFVPAYSLPYTIDEALKEPIFLDS